MSEEGPYRLDEILLSVTVNRAEKKQVVQTLYTKDEISVLPRSAVSTSLQRMVYQMFEAAVKELDC
jgi:hypothetical protein